MRLYFIFMQGCGACEVAKPELAKFATSTTPTDRLVGMKRRTVKEK